MTEDTEWTVSSFDAAHRGKYATEIHGHTWNVRIHWRPKLDLNAIEENEALNRLLDRDYDHRLLDEFIPNPTNYRVAEAIGLAMAPRNICRVDVWRKGRVECGASWNNNIGGESPSTAQHAQKMGEGEA